MKKIILYGLVMVGTTAYADLKNEKLPVIAFCAAGYSGNAMDLDHTLSEPNAIKSTRIKELLKMSDGDSAFQEAAFRDCVTGAAATNLKRALKNKRINQAQYDEYFRRLKMLIDVLNDPDQRKEMGLMAAPKVPSMHGTQQSSESKSVPE
jgi:hypothetical protein